MRKKSFFQVNDKEYSLGQRTWMMGVINVTPDSFSDGGLYFDRKRAIQRGQELASQGADIIDIGGESTRPGSNPISLHEEIERVIPVISGLRKKTDILISVDTSKSEVARAAMDAGADIINDISSFRFDPRMPLLAAEREVPVILMHMKGTPETMQINPLYEDLFGEIHGFLDERISFSLSCGIKREKIIIDPGIGFGKSLKNNLALINNLSFLEPLDRPILVGISRKSFIGKILDLPPEKRIEGTIASAVLSILKGAHILRVHDVEEVRRAVRVAEAIVNEDFPSPGYQEDKEKVGGYAN